MDFVVDALGLVLCLAICLICLAKGIIEDVLGIVDDGLTGLLNVLEDLCVGDDEG